MNYYLEVEKNGELIKREKTSKWNNWRRWEEIQADLGEEYKVKLCVSDSEKVFSKIPTNAEFIKTLAKAEVIIMEDDENETIERVIIDEPMERDFYFDWDEKEFEFTRESECTLSQLRIIEGFIDRARQDTKDAFQSGKDIIETQEMLDRTQR